MIINVLYSKMKKLEAHYIATGHYAKIYKNLKHGEYFIYSNADRTSDQSSLLAGLDQSLLEKLILPLGDLRREEVEKYSAHFKFNVQEKFGSNDYCYNSLEQAKEIIDQEVPPSLYLQGTIVNRDSKIVLSDYKKQTDYQLGEVYGDAHSQSGQKKIHTVILGLSEKDNIIEVGPETLLHFSGTQIVHIKLNTGVAQKGPMVCYLKIKGINEFVKAKLFFKNNSSAIVEFDKPHGKLIKDDLVVIYDSDSSSSKVLGMGKIGKAGSFSYINKVADFQHASPDEEVEGPKVTSEKDVKLKF